MDFKSLISKLDGIEAPAATPKAPKLPDPVQLNEDAELRVLAGTSTLLKELDMNLIKAAQKGQEGKPIGKPDAESDKNVKKKYGYRMDGEPAERDDDETKQERRGRKRQNKGESVELDTEKFQEKFTKMVEAAKPDFLDIDKDGDKKEPMKKAAAEKGGDKKETDKKGMTAKQAKYFGKKDEKTDEGIISTPAKMVGKAIGGVTKAVGAVAGIPGGIKKAFGKGKQKSQDVISGDDEDSRRKESVGEAKKSYSAKSARAGKDIGKPGKNFEKIAKKAGKEYGSKEKGEKVAGAVLKKLRTKESVQTSKKVVAESLDPILKFADMIKLVQESGGQQQIDPLDKTLFAWATRVAQNKLGEGLKAEVYAGMIYERNGGRFEMYDVLSEDQK